MTSDSLSAILKCLQPDTHSRRYNTIWAYTRADNSLFGLSSGLFVLQTLRRYFNTEELEKLGQIQAEICSKYQSYKNKDGKVSYNFYPTQPSKHFGNGYVMQHFDHFRLPDDIDDTALVFLTDLSKTSEMTELVKLLDAHIHPSGVFNTWFGKNMPLEVDICANINMLILFFKNNLGHLPIAQNALMYIVNCIKNIEKQPFQLARHYGHPVLILYHYARFMHMFPETKLAAYIPNLVSITERLIATPLSDGLRMLAETTLLKWGQRREKYVNNLTFNDFYTFIGAPLAPFFGERSWAYKPIFLIHWKSDIYTEVLQLEYKLLYQNQT